MKWVGFVISSLVIHLWVFLFPLSINNSIPTEISSIEIRIVQAPLEMPFLTGQASPLNINRQNDEKSAVISEMSLEKNETEKYRETIPLSEKSNSQSLDVGKLLLQESAILIVKEEIPSIEMNPVRSSTSNGVNMFPTEEIISVEAEVIDELVEVASGEGLSLYLQEIKRRIESFKKYPLEAKREGIGGTVLLSFTLLNNGEIEAIKLERSSGYQILDEEVLSLVEKASPFPPFPQEVYKNKITIKLPIKFIIK